MPKKWRFLCKIEGKIREGNRQKFKTRFKKVPKNVIFN